MAIGPRNDDKFNAVLVRVEPNRKIHALKLVREVTGLGTAEAKDFIEHLPRAVKKDVSPEEGEALKWRFETVEADLQIWSSSRPLPG